MEDLNCPICLRVFYEPVTSSCGHSYCKNCLLEAFKLARRCPICRKTCTLPNSMPVNIVLQKVIESLRKDDLEARKEEEIQRRTELLSELEAQTQFLPVLLMQEVLYLPGTHAELRIFEPRYVSMVQDLVNGTRQFGVYTNFRGSHLGVTLSITHYDELHDGTIRLLALVKKRFVADGVSADFTTVVPNSAISEDQYQSRQLYYCTPRYILDELDTSDSNEIELELADYVEQCLRLMPPVERIKLQSSFDSQGDRSFFALSVLDISYEIVIRLFKTTSYRERIEACVNFARSNPVARNRLRLKPGKLMLDSTWGTIVIVAAILLVFMLANCETEGYLGG